MQSSACVSLLPVDGRLSFSLCVSLTSFHNWTRRAPKTNNPHRTVYNDLPHPPGTYLGKKYQFRTADGSYNNINIPDLGKAKMPYTRTVQSRNPIPCKFPATGFLPASSGTVV